jgi:hypothetical protein
MILRKIGGPSDKILEALETQFGEEYLYAFNFFMPNANWSYDVVDTVFKTKKDVMSIEMPLIGRAEFNPYLRSLGIDNMYYRIGLNYIASFFLKNYFIPHSPNNNRLFEIFEKTHTVLKPWRGNGSHIIYAMQVPEDTSLLGLDVFAAAQYDLTMIRTLTDRPIYVALHPFCKQVPAIVQNNNKYLEGFYKVIELTKSKLTETSTHEMFDNAWCTVCHSSGIAYESVIAGVPAITMSERSFVRPITSSSWFDINSPITPDRLSWLAKIAYCQWSLDEIESGKFKNHVLSCNN